MIARLATAAVGVWLMAAPGVLAFGGAPAVGDHVAGPIVAAAAYVAIAPVLRGVRWAVLPVAAWLVVAPWVLGAPADATISDLASATLAGALTLAGGRRRERVGGGWAAVLHGWRSARG